MPWHFWLCMGMLTGALLFGGTLLLILYLGGRFNDR